MIRKPQKIKLNIPVKTNKETRSSYKNREELDDMQLGLEAARACLEVARIKAELMLDNPGDINIRETKVCSEVVTICVGVIRRIKGMDTDSNEDKEIEIIWSED